VKEYTSPYQDPTFISTNDDDKWRRRAGRSYAIRLNYIEEVSQKYIAHNSMCFLIFQALIERFQNHFMVCFDAAKTCTTEEIRKWFNIQLAGCGQKPWQIRSRKWKITQSKLRLSTIVWRKRDTPLS